MLIRRLLDGKYLEVEEIMHSFRGTSYRYVYTRLSDWMTACVLKHVPTNEIDALLASSHGHPSTEASIEWAKKYHLPKAVPCCSYAVGTR